jgi:intracellular sulfur oxidation DsrE/DsrF family protein
MPLCQIQALRTGESSRKPLMSESSMIRALGITLAAVLVAAAAAAAEQDQRAFVFPRIKEAGGVVVLPQATYQPKAGTKVVFDIATAAKPEEIHKGLDRVARLINLHAGNGVSPEGLQIVVMLHGNAIDCVLTDDAFQRRTGMAANPNLPLLRRLEELGVKLYVCGQSLAQKKYAHEEVAASQKIAVSAMLVNVQSQADGFAVLAVH